MASMASKLCLHYLLCHDAKYDKKGSPSMPTSPPRPLALGDSKGAGGKTGTSIRLRQDLQRLQDLVAGRSRPILVDLGEDTHEDTRPQYDVVVIDHPFTGPTHG